MKEYCVCIKSYLFNNSDYAEYDNFYLESNNLETARATAKSYINNWNKHSTGIMYEVFDMWEVKQWHTNC